MNADTQIRDRLEQAAAQVRIDTEGCLDEIMRGAPHRLAQRRAPATRRSGLAMAAMIVVIVAAAVWVVRSVADNGLLVQDPQTDLIGRILFGRTTGVEQPLDRDLFVLDAATGDITTLANGDGVATAAAWSPDGSRVALTVERGGGTSYALVVANADGSDPVTIVEQDKDDPTLVGPNFVAVAWSPDGTRLAYSGRTIYRGRTVSVLNADGTGARVLDGLWTSVSWSPDGARLLLIGFSDANRDQFDVYTMNVDGTDLVQLTHDDVGDNAASWSPDGTQIVYSKGSSVSGADVDYELDVWVMNADGSGVRRLTDWEGLDLLPVWSPDGEWIAFSSDRSATAAQQAVNRSGEALFGGLSIHVMRPDGSDERLLLDGGDLAAYPMSWTWEVPRR